MKIFEKLKDCATTHRLIFSLRYIVAVYIAVAVSMTMIINVILIRETTHKMDHLFD